jgi:hypothetical protein
MTEVALRGRRRGRMTIVAAILMSFGILISGGCASRAKISASNEIAMAMFAIRDARANGAETYALAILQKSEMLVEEAKQASGADAERIAERALVHAQLANSIAQRESARKQLADAQSIDREAGALKERTTQAVEERLQ